MNELYHHDIKGQKWGVRRFQNPDGSLTEKGKKRYSSITKVKTKNDDIYLGRRKRRKSSQDSDYEIIKQGKRIGHLFLEKHGDDLYINWIDVKAKERGKGYAQAVLKSVMSEAKKNGYKSASLEVPDGDASAHHVYKKLGFKDSGSIDEYYMQKMKRKL